METDKGKVGREGGEADRGRGGWRERRMEGEADGGRGGWRERHMERWKGKQMETRREKQMERWRERRMEMPDADDIWHDKEECRPSQSKDYRSEVI